jgi:ribonuclease HI
MKIEESFLNLISHNNTLNQKQLEILEIVSDIENWKDLALEKEVSKNDMNLLMLLKGNFSLKAQEQIIKNYHMVLEFNNIKAKVYKPTTTEEKIETKNDEDEEVEHIRIYCD